MINNNQKNFPPSKIKFVNPDGSLTQDGYYLLQSLWTRTGEGAGISDQVAAALIATGIGQAGALILPKDVNEVLTTPVGSGAILFNGLRPGLGQWVFNGGANSLKVYPPADVEIDALGINMPYVLAVGKTQFFRSYSLGQMRSLQLG